LPALAPTLADVGGPDAVMAVGLAVADVQCWRQ
jgi:hypothetical protein